VSICVAHHSATSRCRFFVRYCSFHHVFHPNSSLIPENETGFADPDSDEDGPPTINLPENVEDMVDSDQGPAENQAAAETAAQTHPHVRMASTWTPVSSIDPRRAAGLREDGPSVNFDGGEVGSSNECRFFLEFMPMKFIETVVIPTSNLAYPGLNLTLGEFIRYLGVSMLIASYPTVATARFWSNEAQSMYSTHPTIPANIMTRARYLQISGSLKLTNETADYSDPFLAVRKLIDAWNANMDDKFTPGYLSCLDESMVEWLNRLTCPGFMWVQRKPHPYGNEYHTIADAASKIIYRVELMEGKDAPPQRPPADPTVPGKPTVGLMERMTKPLWQTGKAVVMDSGFCVLEGVVRLRRDRGVYACAMIKKRRNWPSGVDGAKMDAELEATEIGQSSTWSGTWKESSKPDQPFTLLAMKDVDFVLKMMTTFGTNVDSGQEAFRAAPSGCAGYTFNYPDQVAKYYQARHAVDDNNNIRQGHLSFEAIMATRHWHYRQFHALIAMSEANAMLGFNHFVRAIQDLSTERGKAAFRLRLAQQLIEHPLFDQERATVPPPPPSVSRSAAARAVPSSHVLVTCEDNSVMFTAKGFKSAKNKYQKHVCKTRGCTRQTRKYCSCDPSRWMCEECFFAAHLSNFLTTI